MTLKQLKKYLNIWDDVEKNVNTILNKREVLDLATAYYTKTCQLMEKSIYKTVFVET